MIREVTTADVDAVMEAAAACGLLSVEELPVLREQLERTLSGESERPGFWLAEIDGGSTAIGVTFCAEEMMADRVWNLLFIGVRAEAQSSGLGSALLESVEARLRAESQRMLIVETANGDDFEQARSFYRKHGFCEEGTVRDFYAEGMHKIVFRKLL